MSADAKSIKKNRNNSYVEGILADEDTDILERCATLVVVGDRSRWPDTFFTRTTTIKQLQQRAESVLEILGGAAEEEEAVATLSTESFTTELCKLWQARQENSPTLESGVAASLAGGAEWIAKAAEQQAEDLRLAAAAEGARQAEGVITGGMTEEVGSSKEMKRPIL